MTKKITLGAFAALGAVGLVSASVPAAEVFQCGAGKPNVRTAKCDCPPGQVEKTEGKVSKCVAAPISPNPVGTVGGGGKAFGSCPAGMTLVPGGSYTMGTGVSTSVSNFCMDNTEVTLNAYKKCVDSGTCTEPTPYKANNKSWVYQAACNWKHPEDRSLHPVNCVDWAQANSFCVSVGKRLPTEDEWEWAARGGDKARTYAWGNEDPSPTRCNAFFSECEAHSRRVFGKDYTGLPGGSDGFAETSPVGSFAVGAGRWGHLDLTGNVSEWTSTLENRTSTKKIHKGGAWYRNTKDKLRNTARESEDPTIAGPEIGVRCARNPA